MVVIGLQVVKGMGGREGRGGGVSGEQSPNHLHSVPPTLAFIVPSNSVRSDNIKLCQK